MTSLDDAPPFGGRTNGAIMVGRDLDEASWAAAVKQDERPRHYAFDLGHRCGLRVVSTSDAAPRFADRVLSKLVGRPEAWAVARATARMTKAGDFVYATDESLGIPYLLIGRHRRKRAQSMAMFVFAPSRFRSRFWITALRHLRLLPAVLVVGLPETAHSLRAHLKSSADRVELLYLPVTIDDRFFRPGDDGAPNNPRPLIVSAGLEQRDYRRLAEATFDLDVDVDVCAVSPDQAGSKTVIPDTVPANMHFAPLSISGLRDLYQRADVFVLSTVPNAFGAGLSAVMEALASGVEVIVSIEEADLAELVADGFVIRADDSSPDALRRVIESRLAELTSTRIPRVRLTADEYVSRLAEQFLRFDAIPHIAGVTSDAAAPSLPGFPAGRSSDADADLLSVVIPVAGADNSLITQLDALFSQETTTRFEVVISHNMPSAADRGRLAEIIAPYSDRALRVVEADKRPSAAHARNTGALAARGALLAFCDADDRVHPGWIDAMVAGLASHDAVTGAIVEIAPPGQSDWRPPATPGELPTFHGAPYLLSGNLAIKRDVFEGVGGFDETLTRCEDIAIGWALQHRGYEIGFAPDAKLDYHHRSGLTTMLKQHYLYGRGMAEVLAKYPNPLHDRVGQSSAASSMTKLKPNGQPHRRTLISQSRRAAIGLGRVVGLVVRP